MMKTGVLSSGEDTPEMNAGVEALTYDQKRVMAGIFSNEITLFPIRRTVKLHKDINHNQVEIAKILSF